MNALAQSTPVQRNHSREEVHDWLNQRAAAMGMRVFPWMRQAEMRGEWLRLSVYVEGDLDAYQECTKLQQLQDAWNYGGADAAERLPRLFLLPSSRKPEKKDAALNARPELEFAA